MSQTAMLVSREEALAKLTHWASRNSKIRASFNGGHSLLGTCTGSLEVMSPEQIRLTWLSGTPDRGALILSLSDSATFEFSELVGDVPPRFEDSTRQFTSCIAINLP